MRAEGMGEISPSPVRVKLSRPDMLIAKEWATTQAMARRYAARQDTWGRGMIQGRRVRNVGDVRDGEMPAFIGKLGEIAFVCFMNGAVRSPLLRVDFSKRDGGDGGRDFELFGFRIDVKTSTHRERLLVRKTRKDGRATPLESHRYVFAYVNREVLDDVLLLGWISRERVLASPAGKSPFGHVNYLISLVSLEPMASLATLAKGGA